MASKTGIYFCRPIRILPHLSPLRRYPYVLLVAAAVMLHFPRPVAGAVRASRGEITLPTYPWGAVKHPYFRGTDKVNIYPYPMLDFLTRDPTNRVYQTVVLENEYLRVTFLPELGGKIHEVIDRATGKPMFYVNHVVKPGLIGQCGAWTSGGVEWNTGPQGHTVSCLQPIDVVILPPEPDGSRSVAIGETERIYGTKWTVVVTLRPGRSFLEERIRIYNPTETIRPYYFWNCTAAPNTPGFRFIYPMTLGMDHSGDKFFSWPIDHGKDLTRGTNYQDASSIFAYQCDQDFFGAYNDDLDHGVVAFANHHQVPGKKAWTWGQGGFGQMHQMDLTDNDGPYNEVQTGPLLTQGEVGRLDPCEAVEWKEWWYPVHGIGGFTFANQEVAVHASQDGGVLLLKMLGTRQQDRVLVQVRLGRAILASASGPLSPLQATELRLDIGTNRSPVEVRLADLAHFTFPLELPARTQPPGANSPQTAAEWAEAGGRDFLFARYPDAEAHFGKALERDPKSVEARTGLAFLNLNRPGVAVKEAEAALAVAPGNGRARFALAVAQSRGGMEFPWLAGYRVDALDNAWEAALDPAVAVAGRALVAKMSLCRRDYDAVIQALSDPGPWSNDPVCRNRLAFALLQKRITPKAVALARANLERDPLDTFARSILWLAQSEDQSPKLGDLIAERGEPVLDLVADYAGIAHESFALQILQEYYMRRVSEAEWNPLARYWARFLTAGSSEGTRTQTTSRRALEPVERPSGARPFPMVFPHRYEILLPLMANAPVERKDGYGTLYLGHVLFHLGRFKEGRLFWRRAAELGADPVVAYRALGMAAKTLDGDLKPARDWLEKAHHADPQDSIVARDLANVLFALADKENSEETRRPLILEAKDRLKVAFAEGQGRSDFVALLARAESRLGEYAETAQLLDAVRVTVWEGAHEVHDLFEEAHLALGKSRLASGRAAEALVEFNRALEYPKNLATGKLENAREAHIQLQRGHALEALGRHADALAAWRKAADEPASKDRLKEEARRQARVLLNRQ
jgi:tetratricopeptide (TPR) repeat protein